MASIVRDTTLEDQDLHEVEKEPPEPSHLIPPVAAAQSLMPEVLHGSDDETSTSHDATNPLNWSYRYKMFIVVLVSAMTTVDTFATLISVSAIPSILSDFHTTDQSYLVILVSIWELGEGIGPFLIAPLSEIYGRLPVYHTANILFLLCSVGGALSTSIGMLTAFRFLNGLVIASLTMGPAMIGDMFKQEERGAAMAVLYMGPLLGPVVAPIIGGFLANAKGWRWTFWLISMAVAVIQIPSFIFMRETNTGRLQPRGSAGAHKGPREKNTHIITQAILRPFKFLFLCPVVLILSIYVAIVYGYLYIILTTLTTTLETIYGFSEWSSGLSYLGLGIGMVAGVILCGATSDAYIKKKGTRATPEHRLPPMILGSFVFPVGLFIYGWTLRAGIPWIIPLIGSAVMGFGLLVTVIPAESYLVDAYTSQSAAAVAACSSLKSVSGAVLPLAGPPLYARLGLGWGSSLLAFVAIALTPVPILFMKYGSTPDEIRRLTNEWVVDRGGAKDQLEGIEDIIEKVALFSEGLGEVIMEAWVMLVEGGAWQARYKTREEAIASIDSSLVKELRLRNQTGRNRKAKFIWSIQTAWGTDVADWRFECLGENNLWHSSIAAAKRTYDNTIYLATQIAFTTLPQERIFMPYAILRHRTQHYDVGLPSQYI
ncbi:hypothetical protein MMC11_007865 [Xylographa trunciseda]|nr:hypothetical protein [Xylographa trunciseda]